MKPYILWAALVFVAASLASAQQESPILVKVVASDKQVVVGELGRENDTHIEVFDLKTGKPRTFKKDDLQSVRKDIKEEEAATAAGLPFVLAWKMRKVVPAGAVAGAVVKVDGAVIYLSFGLKQGITKGQEVVAFRGDETLKDPVSGEVLGKHRRKVGRLEVIEVTEKFCKAKLLGDLEIHLEVGDVVEPAASKRSIAILPLVDGNGNETDVGKLFAEELTTGLVNRGISVVERTLLDKGLGELGMQQTALFDAAQAQKVGKQLGAFAILTGTILPKLRYAEAQVRLINVETGEILVATSQKMTSVRRVISGNLGETTADKHSKKTSLDGEWVLVEGWLSGGAKMTGPRWDNKRIIFKGTQYFEFAGNMAIEGRIEMDTTKSPMQLDWIPLKGGTAKYRGKTTPGIFEISKDGTMFRFCAGESEGARPVEFNFKPAGWTVQVYKKR